MEEDIIELVKMVVQVEVVQIIIHMDLELVLLDLPDRVIMVVMEQTKVHI